MPNKSKWQRFSPLGLLLIGLGLSVTGDAMIAKGQGRPWFVRGTVGLVLFNAGLAVFGEAVKSRALYEQEARP
ncbi:MAG: hypothetical protein MUE40_18750, partial [Anaerolineae bacterium]|nr:hypothetical protein [Anaerolineae bacterium]